MNYCEACRTTEGIEDCYIARTWLFTLCRYCKAQHRGVSVRALRQYQRIKEALAG